MPTSQGPEDNSVVIRFGGGIHSRASEDEIDARECASGQNFDLDPQNREFKNRKPFDLIGTVPNGSEIRGFANLLKSDGTVSVLVQAGTTVYEWDGVSTFTSVGSVDANAKIRGRLEHNWQLDDKVIITDLNLSQPVMEWDGTTLQNVTFTNEDGSTAFGAFRAKYCTVSNERVIFANVYDNGTNTPHLMVGSQRGSYTIITVNNRPSSSLSEADPYFLIQPDYRPINGMIEAFGKVVTSSKQGSLFQLTGQSSKDFAFEELFPRSGASGDEAVAYIGNDIIYGRAGRIESVFATERFGDVEVDDLSIGISDLLEDFDDWTIVYNSRKQRVYCIPATESQAWVLHKSLVPSELSPWSKWVTAHPSSFAPTAIMNMLDPSDGLEYVFFGDSTGNLYRMEGSGASGDGGINEIKSERLSPLVSAQLDGEIFSVQGWFKYRAGDAATVTVRLEYGGMSLFNESITIDIPAVSNRAVYGGGYYYSGEAYYGSFSGKLTRQKFAVPGKGNEFQVRVTTEGATDVAINEIGLRFEVAT